MTAGGLYVESSSRVGAPDTKSEPANKIRAEVEVNKATILLSMLVSLMYKHWSTVKTAT